MNGKRGVVAIPAGAKHAERVAVEEVLLNGVLQAGQVFPQSDEALFELCLFGGGLIREILEAHLRVAAQVVPPFGDLLLDYPRQVLVPVLHAQ